MRLAIVLICTALVRADRLLGFDFSLSNKRDEVPVSRSTQQHASARAYDVDSAKKNVEFPEDAYRSVFVENKIGMAFSGGGSRSFTLSLGYISGMLALGEGVWDAANTFATTVSGGTWAMSTWVYHDPSRFSNFLGTYTPPEKFSINRARVENFLSSARALPVRKDFLVIALLNLMFGNSPEDVWHDTVYEVFFSPCGIPKDAIASLSEKTVEDVLERNPNLLETHNFVTPCQSKLDECARPFHVIDSTVLGPAQAVPFSIFDRKYLMLESSPLYVGFPHALNVSYGNVVLKTGGLIEPVGFGGELPNHFQGHSGNDPIENIKLPKLPWSLLNATTASSWAPAATIAEEPLLSILDNTLVRTTYFNPMLSEKEQQSKGQSILLGDGSNVENDGVASAVRRYPNKMIAFINTDITLSVEYDPYFERPNVNVDVDSCFASFFGVNPLFPELGEDYTRDQLWRRTQFAKVIKGLQKSIKEGRGGVYYAKNLITVKNDWWGIRSGHSMDVLFVYLARNFQWEAKLPENTKNHIGIPESKDPQRLPNKLNSFNSFPHLNIGELRLPMEVSNAMADLAHFTVLQNRDLFIEALS